MKGLIVVNIFIIALGVESFLPSQQYRDRNKINNTSRSLLTTSKGLQAHSSPLENPPSQFPVKIRQETFLLQPDNEKNVIFGNRKIYSPWRKRLEYHEDDRLQFDYDYNELIVPNENFTEKVRIILLIMPIGVGIGRWYYDRLLEMVQTCNLSQDEKCEEQEMYTNVFLAPDLLGCGTACHPSLVSEEGRISAPTLPLINVEDWSKQLISLMKSYEQEYETNNVEWCLVSNGGCVPIALNIASNYEEVKKATSEDINSGMSASDPKSDSMFQGKLTNLILSATPRAESLMRQQDTDKIHKSYKTLSGTLGNLFWWYSLRRNGNFIQKFSEKNLAARAENLGEEWTPKCVKTAKSFKGRSRFSTFAFLAGSLNGGNEGRLESLKGSDINIGVITGGDKRANPAKSWFWQKNRTDKEVTSKAATEIDQATEVETTSLVSLLLDNNIDCNEIVVKGRRCPAHEDAEGFHKALFTLINEKS